MGKVKKESNISTKLHRSLEKIPLRKVSYLFTKKWWNEEPYEAEYQEEYEECYRRGLSVIQAEFAMKQYI